MKKEKYMVPDELKKMNREHLSYSNLRDRYVKIPFGFKKAVKCSQIAEEKRSEFWIGIKKLYPHLRNKSLEYDNTEGEVRIQEDKLSE